MPRPHPGEHHGDFMHRCMTSTEAIDDYPDRDQRAAVCMSFWEQRNNVGTKVEQPTYEAPKGRDR